MRALLLMLVMAGLLDTGGAAFARDAAWAQDPQMPRRQQGILTGMPFMANLAPRTFVDDLGRKIFLASAPTRIVSLAPSVTEILYAIGAGRQVIAVTPFCDFPPDAQLKPKIGYTRPNLEALIALHPDLVIAPTEFLRADLLDKLERVKIPVFLLEAKKLEDIPSHMQTLGRMLGKTAEANRAANDLRQAFAALKLKTDPLPKVRTLYVLNSEPLITVGPGSFIHQLIGLAGGENIASTAGTAYPRLSMEQVLAQDPEVIVFPVGPAEGIPDSEQARWGRWTTMTAVKAHRLEQINGDLLNRPGPRIVAGVEQLAALLHPEIAAAEGPR